MTVIEARLVDLDHMTIACAELAPETPDGLPVPDGCPVIFINGLSMQAIDWPAALLDAVRRTHPVVVFDNRDAGLSSAFGPVVLGDQGAPPATPYTLYDMAADTVALLDHLGHDRVHLVGYSMGGRIAQIIAADHPGRVASLTCMMSSGGQRRVEAAAEVRDALGAARAESLLRAPDIALFVAQSRLLDGAALTAGDDEHRDRIEAAVTRSYRPLGTGRQMAAVEAAGDRADLLGRITCPTLFIHGTADPVVPFAQAAQGAARIPGARLHPIEGLGHLPTRAALDRIIAPLVAHIGLAG
ncbi:alpha/beta hydrolase [Tistrella bauzanensis]|uniref:Alpha/beta hydrolase n=1 Tax=Tistrella arctica TaxID=3133430 RepID=A0ABU9YH58_9PROT